MLAEAWHISQTEEDQMLRQPTLHCQNVCVAMRTCGLNHGAVEHMRVAPAFE